jgi:uncharacterized protein YcfJ
MDTLTMKTSQGRLARAISGLIASLALVPGLTLADAADAYAGYGTWRYARVIDVVPLVRMVQIERAYEVCEDPMADRRRPMAEPQIARNGFRRRGNAERHDSAVSMRDSRRVVVPAPEYQAGPVSQPRPRIEVRSEPRIETTAYCRIEHRTEDVQRVDGYRVTYEYQGQRSEIITDADPGERVRVRVSGRSRTR